jgi:hypothetical protein
MEILMLVGGLSAFVISFFLPDGKTAEPGEGISQEELQQLFDDEVELSRQKIGDMTKETLDYSMEKTERSLEKIANEKIMAVGEYSDTVLDQINQSHNQVVFLSDMLHKSKEELTELLNRADQASKDANVRANEAYDLADHAMKLAEDAADRAEEAGRTAVSAEEKMIDARRLMQDTAERIAPAEERFDAEDAVEVPGEIFEDLVNEFVSEDDEEADTTPRRGAEERLAENLASFRESLKEKDDTVPSADVFAENEERKSTEESFSPLEEIFGKSDFPQTEIADPNDFMGMTEQELREMGIGSESEEETTMVSGEDEYAGLSEEEKMEALLRAATEELAQDVTSVTGISEARWEPEEDEADEEVSGDAEEEAREAKAQALDALKAEAESEERESRARALEALKAEAESVSLPTEEEMLPAEDAEFLQSLLQGADPERPDLMDESNDSTSEPADAVMDAMMAETDATESEDTTAESEKEEKPAKKTTKKAPKKSAKSGGSSRRKPSKQGEQMSIPEELLKQDSVSLQFAPGEETTKNNNARILEMHRMGRSDMAIAKDLGMGIGEVKLVIALDEIS